MPGTRRAGFIIGDITRRAEPLASGPPVREQNRLVRWMSIKSSCRITALIFSDLENTTAEEVERREQLFKKLQEHVRKEEGRMFPAARRLLKETRAAELGRQIAKRKQQQADGSLERQARD
jgi:hypothetical protein